MPNDIEREVGTLTWRKFVVFLIDMTKTHSTFYQNFHSNFHPFNYATSYNGGGSALLSGDDRNVAKTFRVPPLKNNELRPRVFKLGPFQLTNMGHLNRVPGVSAMRTSFIVLAVGLVANHACISHAHEADGNHNSVLLGAVFPQVSRSGETVAFSYQGAIWKMPREGDAINCRRRIRCAAHMVT